MARPSATSSRMLPRLAPVNSRPSRSPQTSWPCTLSSAPWMAALTLTSCSLASFSKSSERVAGELLPDSALAAAARLAGSSDEISTAARSNCSLAFNSGSLSAASAFSIRPSLPSSTWSFSSVIAAARTARSGDTSLSTAMADSSSRRMRLLLTASSASAGSVAAAPLAASTALPSFTM